MPGALVRRRGNARSATLLLVATALTAGCPDATGGDGTSAARLALRVAYPAAVIPGLFELNVDRARIRIIRPPSESVLDTLVTFPADQSQLTVTLKVPLASRREQLTVGVELSAGNRLLFAGNRDVDVTDGSTIAPTVPLQYVGPGTDMTSIRLAPRDTALRPGEAFRFNVFAFAGQASLELFYVGFSTSDPAVATVDAQGLLRGPTQRGEVRLRVVSPTGVKDSTTVWFSPPATSLVAAGGDGQEAQAGTQLATLLAVRAVAADGEGVPGVRVQFLPLAGGAVRDTNAITDAQGVARTAAILGTIAGLQLFEATAPFLPPVTFRTTALAGPPGRVTILSGNSQIGTVGQVLPSPMVAQVTDAVGNPIPGAPVTWSVSQGGGTLEDVSTETDLAGLAFATYRLGTVPGVNRVRAAALSGLLFTEFTAQAGPGAPRVLTPVSGDLQADTARAVLAPFVVQVSDEFGNRLNGILVSWSQVEGGGTLDPTLASTDATGRARTTYHLPATPGTAHVRAAVNGVADTVTFTASTSPASPSALVIVGGNAQTGAPGDPLAPFVVRVTDQFGNPVAGVTVEWVIEDGDASLSVPTSVSGAAGTASVTCTLGAATGPVTVRARLAGGASVQFTATSAVP